jgi:hypothetical protein
MSIITFAVKLVWSQRRSSWTVSILIWFCTTFDNKYVIDLRWLRYTTGDEHHHSGGRTRLISTVLDLNRFYPDHIRYDLWQQNTSAAEIKNVLLRFDMRWLRYGQMSITPVVKLDWSQPAVLDLNRFYPDLIQHDPFLPWSGSARS